MLLRALAELACIATAHPAVAAAAGVSPADGEAVRTELQELAAGAPTDQLAEALEVPLPRKDAPRRTRQRTRRGARRRMPALLHGPMLRR